MKSTTIFIATIGILLGHYLNAQTFIEANSKNWTEHRGKATFEGDVIHLKETGGTAILWVNGVNFKNGTVELDIKGKDERGNSFVGLAFHGADDENYDAVYFRPFNFKSVEKKNNAMQYIDAPKNVWHVLRKKYPGKYESAVQPVPDPNDWFHAKIVINYPEVKVYVNDSTTPTFVVEQISKRREGKIGLWVDSEDGWFRNVTITEDN
ncbi:DUF1080 domain-containing protein [Fulvivirgaceae bacterium BMA12]|uniref:DUF1080 domain-containing protein n=1 Tax=Agaribacillus aureus TaxID=3051825 RepID=A0ABT8L6B4_9BACT|nr:DUF1080 domain-containing protein [Fulvivirgaceae bacterium BMA12]